MWLTNVDIPGSKALKNIRIEDGKIKEVLAGPPPVGARESLDCKGALVFPGLVNSHDHLDFNLFPPTGNRVYENYRQWGYEIQSKNAREIRKVLQIPKPLRIEWGLYKNLLNGVTTVVNHGERLDISLPLITVLQHHVSLHSVCFEKHWQLKLNMPRKLKQNYVIHAGEGVDDCSHREIDRLLSWNLLGKKLITVHAIAMNERQAEKVRAVVWCPSSNTFLFNRTARIDKLKSNTEILFGTDSTLTASWNLWEHLRQARATAMLSDSQLFASLTETPCRLWRESAAGISRTEDADLVIARKKASDAFDAFFSLNPEDLLMVIHKGQIRLFDETLQKTAVVDRLGLKQFSTVDIHGSVKFVYGDLPGLCEKVRRHHPCVSFPFTVHSPS